jgi:hypothetical protein
MAKGLMASPSCTHCGRLVRWAKREGGGNYPPLTLIGSVLVIDPDGIVRTEMAFNRHYCLDSEVEAHLAVKEAEAGEIRERVESNRLVQEETNRRREETWAIARPRPCAKCGAEPDEPCENLTLRAKGTAAETSWPHQVRYLDEFLEKP